MTARGTLESRRMVLLRVLAASGSSGLGEAVPMSLRGGNSLEEIVDQLEGWGKLAVTGPEMPDITRMSPPARVAVETALADVASRDLGVPLHEFLVPGSVAQPVPCNATLTTDTPGRVLSQAELWAADGFTTFKLKVGSGDDAGQVEAVRKGLGEGVSIRVDANAAWDEEQAEDVLSRIEPFDVELAEQPVDGIAALARLRQKTSISIVADESVSSREEAEMAAVARACDAVTVKLSKIGSLDASLGGHLPTYLSSALDGPVGIAAAAHVAQTLPRDGAWSNVAHGLATERLFDGTIAAQGRLLDGPNLPVPVGNGLGITIDEAALETYRL
ncbi:MAG: mandelate racemase/muconate lactonizing enzyme family protein [Solirubrobacterales bacterium]